jgi:hypothetical protein
MKPLTCPKPQGKYVKMRREECVICMGKMEMRRILAGNLKERDHLGDL